MNKPPLFQLEHISYSIPSKTILHDISLRIYKGDFITILGPSAAGKSTLLRLFNALDTPTSGSIYYNRAPMETCLMTDLRKHVGMVFQIPVIVQGNVRDNLLLVRRWERSLPAISEKQLVALLSKVGMEYVRLSQDAKALSGGEQQRLALARILLNEPEVLLLDEPTANLDPQMAQRIVHLVHSLYETLKLTVIMVSHNHALVEKYANRIVFLMDGKIVEEGPADILNNPSTEQARSFLNKEVV